MSAAPETRTPGEPESESPPPDAGDSRESDECHLQWVALVVLLACWLAEAYV